MKKSLPIFIVIAIIIAAGSFFGGIAYGKSSQKKAEASQFANFRGGQTPTGNGAQRGVGQGTTRGGLTNGSIISSDDKSITVKLADGGSKIVFFATSTAIMKSTTGAISDLKVGDNVMITGSANADGSLTATSIQLRPTSTPPQK